MTDKTSNTPEDELPESDGDGSTSWIPNLGVTRRDVVKVAGAAGLISAGGSVGSAQGCDSCGQAQPPGPDLCRVCGDIDDACEYIGKSNRTDGRCYTGDVPEDATEAVIKAGQECIYIEDLSGDICVPEGCPGFSHIEFYGCPLSRVTALSATCETLTIETADAVGDTISVDYRLLYNGTLVEDPDPVSVADDDDQSSDGVYHVDLTSIATDSWNEVAIDSVTHSSDGTDMLAEGGFTAPVTQSTGLCNPPAVTTLTADCDELTIETDHASGDSLTVDFELLYNGTSVVDPGADTVADDDDGTADGTFHVPLTGYTSDSWNEVAVKSVENDQTDTDMLAEGGYTAPVTLSANGLCNPPAATDFTANCDELTIETDHASGDSLTVDFKLQVEDTSGTLVDVIDPSAVSVADGDDGSSDGTYHVSLTGITDDSWDHVIIESVENDQTGTDMLKEGGHTAPVAVPTGELCNPPAVTDLATNCGTIYIETNTAADGDNLNVDFSLDEIDESGNTLSNGVFAAEEGTTVSNGIATVDIDSLTASTDLWNVVEITSVEHTLTGAEMLDSAPVRELVVVNRTL